MYLCIVIWMIFLTILVFLFNFNHYGNTDKRRFQPVDPANTFALPILPGRFNKTSYLLPSRSKITSVNCLLSNFVEPVRLAPSAQL